MLTKELDTISEPMLARWRDYYALTKPGVVKLLVFTAIVGMFLATPGMVPWETLLFASLGIGRSAASGAAVNHVLDQRLDAKMARTRDRPLPMGRISEKDALAFAISLGVVGIAILVLLVNLLTAALTFISLIGYAVVYTVYLKRATPQNIVIGGAAGASPPVLGWAAVTNEVSGYSIAVFDHLHVDPTPFLGIGGGAQRRLCEGGSADAAGNPRPRGHEVVRALLLDSVTHRYLAPILDGNDRRSLSLRCGTSWRGVHLLCDPAEIRS